MEKGIQASGFVVQPRLHFKHVKDQMLYQYLLTEADYLEDIGEVKIKLSELEKETGWTRRMLTASLERLEKLGYITFETLYQKKGILVKIIDYERFQKLKNYKKEDEKHVQGKYKESTSDVHEKEPENACGSKGEDVPKNENVQGMNKGSTSDVKISEFLPILVNSINSNNNNKTLKEYIDEAPVKNKNLSTAEDIEIFVDFALRTNALPNGVSKKILILYFDCIRLTRSTCTVSANILVKFIEKIQKYSLNQIHYALWKHVEQHDDKKETYTLGILRNTKEPDARRGLIKMKNKGGVIDNAIGQGDNSENSQYDYGF